MTAGLKIDPKIDELHFNLGVAYDKINKKEDCIIEMKETIKLNPKHANALNYLGYTYAEKGINLNEAISLIKKALQIKPDDGYYLDSLAWAYFQKGWVDDAIEILEKAVTLVKDDPVMYEHLGDIYLKKLKKMMQKRHG